MRRRRQSGRRLTPPWPDAVIGCGRNAVRPALAIKRASGGRTIAAHIQDPRFGRDRFDLMIVPRHDRLRGPRVLVTKGAVHRVTPPRLEAERRRFPALAALPRPIVGCWSAAPTAPIGSTRRRSPRSPTGSRPPSSGAAARSSRRRRGAPGRTACGCCASVWPGFPATIWDGSGENPYFAYLAVADALIVTADSVSMVSEAAATGKPVHIIDLPGGDAKFARFHAAMREAGITRPFAGEIEDWSYRPPDDTARAGAALRDLVAGALVAREQREHAL